MTTIKTKVIFILISFWALSSVAMGQNLYSVKRNANQVILSFNQPWCFSELAIPSCSTKIWGDSLCHSIIGVKANNKNYILSSNKGDTHLRLNLPYEAIKEFVLTSVDSFESKDKSEALPYFKATSKKTKSIEDQILLVTEAEKGFVNKNNCFSCHQSLPLALALDLADKKGYNIPKKSIEQLIRSIGALQGSDGSYFFSKQPLYGKKSTSLFAGFYLARLSRFLPDLFLEVGGKLESFLRNQIESEKPIKADFVLEPYFNNESTNLLFEGFFQQTLYLSAPQKHIGAYNRAKDLLKISSEKHNLDISKKLMLLIGMPYTYQVKPEQRQLLKRELEIEESCNSRILAIKQVLKLYIEEKLYNETRKNREIYKKSLVWNCLEDIITNNPTYLEGYYDEN